MKALIFAAGKGERMRPLTTHTPKPLLCVGGKPLIVWHLEKLAALGVSDVVINISWLADVFAPTLGDGQHWGLRLHYRDEGSEPLETGGGMLNALPLLGPAPFYLLNGDVWTDFNFSELPKAPQGLAHLLMVEPPEFAPAGDFFLCPDGQLLPDGDNKLTYAGIGVYRPEILAQWSDYVRIEAHPNPHTPRFKLAPILRAQMLDGRITGQHFRGAWTDVGTPERLALLDARLRQHADCSDVSLAALGAKTAK